MPIFIVSLENELRSIDLDRLSTRGHLSRTSILFPRVTEDEIVYEWISIHGIPNDTTPLRRLNCYLFPNVDVIKRGYEMYLGTKAQRISDAKDLLKERLELMDEMGGTLQSTKGLDGLELDQNKDRNHHPRHRCRAAEKRRPVRGV